MPLVLVETIDPGARSAATRRHSERLISRFSATASTIHSQRPTRPRSSSKFPGVISALAASVKKATGLCFAAFSIPASAAAFRLG